MPGPRKPSAHGKPRRAKATQHGNAGAPVAQPLWPDARQSLPGVFLRTPIRHPLIYRKRIERIEGNPRPGEWVAVYAIPNELLGYGIFNPRSEIPVRMIRYGAELPDKAFWQSRLEQAVRLRHEFLRLPDVTDTYRVLHAEGDGFPGLVIDRFGDTLSAEVFSLGMYQRCEAILERLAPLCGTSHWLVQPSPNMLPQEGVAGRALASEGGPQQVTVHEHGTRFRVQFEGGHKTGFFCDQRDNRYTLARFCRDRSVLDLCCYTGGFSIQTKRLGQAAEVTGVDLDEHPLRLARDNANLNQVRVKFVQADVFPYMRDMLRSGRLFDVVVLDPPKLIRSRAEIEEGTRKHFDLNRLAMQLVAPGGLLLSCTCAGLLSQEEFTKLLYAAARQAGAPEPGTESEDGFARRGPRAMQLLMRTGAAADHPVASNCPETEYLKAAWMRLE